MARFNVNFSASTHEAVVQLSERLDLPMADVVREALSLFWWVSQETEAGNTLLIQRGGQVTELLIPSLKHALAAKAGPAAQRRTPRGDSGRVGNQEQVKEGKEVNRQSPVPVS